MANKNSRNILRNLEIFYGIWIFLCDCFTICCETRKDIPRNPGWYHYVPRCEIFHPPPPFPLSLCPNKFAEHLQNSVCISRPWNTSGGLLTTSHLAGPLSIPVCARFVAGTVAWRPVFATGSSIFLFHCHSTNDPYSYLMQPSSTLFLCSNWQCRYTEQLFLSPLHSHVNTLRASK